MLPRDVAESTSAEPRAIEWPAGAYPSCMTTSSATAGTAQAAAGIGRAARLVTRAYTWSMTTNATAAPIQIHAFVAVIAASAASKAASRNRPRMAASAAAIRRVVRNGSTTAEAEGKRKDGLRAKK